MHAYSTEQKTAAARNMRKYRMLRYPGRDGMRKCAEAFGVSPPQWAAWEGGMEMPDPGRLAEIAAFFGVTAVILTSAGDDTTGRVPGQPAPTPSGFLPRTLQPEASAPRPAAPAGTAPAGPAVKYIPVFVVLPSVPENMEEAYEQFEEIMNRGTSGPFPSLPFSVVFPPAAAGTAADRGEQRGETQT